MASPSHSDPYLTLGVDATVPVPTRSFTSEPAAVAWLLDAPTR